MEYGLYYYCTTYLGSGRQANLSVLVASGYDVCLLININGAADQPVD